jgi:hypothetical protein
MRDSIPWRGLREKDTLFI